MFAFPAMILSMIFVAVLGQTLTTMALVIGIVSWMGIARLVRASFLSLKEQEFTTAARCVGVTNSRIMIRHILPNAFGPIIVAATLGVARAIIMESGLSYLGLGIQAPIPSWGGMLYFAQNQLDSAAWLSFFPGLAIFVAVLSINFVGDGLRDAMDPRHLR
jgi:peptide/nickel transport system permease protein